jgi:hypothetical protein
VASVEIASPRASAAAIGLFTRTMHRSPCKVPPCMRVTRRVENRHTARSALLQGCVSRLEGTVTKLSSPRRAREKSCEVIFCFHLHTDEPTETAARHARDRADWPKVGIFAQRRRMRPNRLGLCICRGREWVSRRSSPDVAKRHPGLESRRRVVQS